MNAARNIIQIAEPPLTTDRSSDVRKITAIFSVFSLLLLAAAWYASSLAPRMMESNYRSVKYGAEMQAALVAIYLSAVNLKQPPADQIERFDRNFFAESINITESQEPEAVKEVDRRWSEFKKLPMTPTIESFQGLSTAIERVVELNEAAMYRHEQTANSIGKTVIFGGLLGLGLAVLYSLQIAYSLKDG